jgi:glutamine synthetase
VSPTWGYDNRTVAVRIPAGKSSARRLEVRVPGADANPYLLYAVILSGVLEGIARQLDPGQPIHGDGYEQAGETLPAYMPEAVRLFQGSDFVARNLGEELQRIYSLSKLQEHAVFRAAISELEYQSYLERL